MFEICIVRFGTVREQVDGHLPLGIQQRVRLGQIGQDVGKPSIHCLTVCRRWRMRIGDGSKVSIGSQVFGERAMKPTRCRRIEHPWILWANMIRHRV